MMDDVMDLICNLLNTARQIARILWTVQQIYSRTSVLVLMEMLPMADRYDNHCQTKESLERFLRVLLNAALNAFSELKVDLSRSRNKKLGACLLIPPYSV